MVDTLEAGRSLAEIGLVDDIVEMLEAELRSPLMRVSDITQAPRTAPHRGDNPMTAVHPDAVLETLKAGVRPQKQRNLNIIHAVCRELHGLGSRDFSLATVGRMSEERHGMSRNALYNKASEDFRTLINAWSRFAGDMPGKRATSLKPLAEEDLLRRIDDPALRALLGGIVAERNRLRGEVNLLRANAKVVIDRRILPGHVHVMPEGQVTQVLPPLADLTDSEVAALRKAISPEFLRQEGWHEGPHGQIVNAKGRTLFDVGFTNAVRKVLFER